MLKILWIIFPIYPINWEYTTQKSGNEQVGNGAAIWDAGYGLRYHYERLSEIVALAVQCEIFLRTGSKAALSFCLYGQGCPGRLCAPRACPETRCTARAAISAKPTKNYAEFRLVSRPTDFHLD